MTADISKPPKAKKIPKKIVQHGHQRTDDYAWLRDKNWKKFVEGDLTFHNPQILDYINGENAWTDYRMKETQEIAQSVYNEILSMEREEDSSFPIQRGDYDYYWRSRKKDDYLTFCRKKRVSDSPEEAYFDVNKEAEGRPLFMHGRSDTSEDNRFYGYTYNLTGSMEKTLKVRNLDTGEDFDWEIPGCTGSWLWIDNEHLYFVERDEQSRGKNIYKVNIHQGPTSKKLVFTKPEEYSGLFLSIGTTKDKKYFTVQLSGGSTEVHYISKAGTDKFSFFAKGDDDVTYSLEHHDNIFYILTNRGGHHNYRVMTCPADGNHDVADWGELIEESPRHYIQSIVVYNDYLVMSRKNCQKALAEIEICHLATRERTLVTMPGAAYTLGLIGARNHRSTKILFYLETPLSMEQMFELNLGNSQTRLVGEKTPPNFEPDKYVVKREYAVARDGEEIPLTIVHKKDLKRDGGNKAFVYAYGSYGAGMPAFFSPSIFSLVDRGLVHCIAHIRGGDDKGFRWYLDGKNA